jgi:hypothetical protein
VKAQATPDKSAESFPPQHFFKVGWIFIREVNMELCYVRELSGNDRKPQFIHRRKDMISKKTVWIVAGCLSVLLATGNAQQSAWEQLQGMSGGYSGNVPEASPPKCVEGCEDTGSGGQESSGDDDAWEREYRAEQRRIAKEEQRMAEERRRKQEAYNLNEQGNRAYEQRNWSTSIDLYKKALKQSPQDKVIQQNLKNAETEEKRQEENRKAQSEFQKRMGKLTSLMPNPKPLSSSVGERRFENANVPLPGFSADRWKEYLAAKDEANRLYLKLNREGVLSDADAQAFYAALNRRNALWTQAMEQPLAAADRDELRLSLPIVVNKSLLSLSAVLQGTMAGSRSGATSSDASQQIAYTDRRTAAASGGPPSKADAITTAFVADYFSGKITKLSESEVGKAIESARGVQMKGTFDNLLRIAKVAVKAREEGVAGAGAQTADFIISGVFKPSAAAQAGFAVEGGRMYSNVAFHSLNRFMIDAMNATGADFDPEEFWKRFNESLTTSQKGVIKWIQFGE